MYLKFAECWKIYGKALFFEETFRVTRLGEFSPIGWLFSLGTMYFKNIEAAQILRHFFLRKSNALLYIINVSSYVNFGRFKNFSGHPGCIGLNTSKLHWGIFKRIPDRLLVFDTSTYIFTSGLLLAPCSILKIIIFRPIALYKLFDSPRRPLVFNWHFGKFLYLLYLCTLSNLKLKCSLNEQYIPR
jgi:hypothetical protein